MEQSEDFNGFIKIFFQKYFQLRSKPKPQVALITILHTFGKDLKFHPHLHLIVSNGFFGKKFNPMDISFDTKFNKLWRLEVLKNLGLINLDKYKYGFYVWCDNRSLNKSKQLTKYIGRYVRHPAISNGRIRYYNKNKIIFSYKNNKNKEILITKSITDFVASLIQHIPPQQFKITRYYGAYERRTKKKYFNVI